MVKIRIIFGLAVLIAVIPFFGIPTGMKEFLVSILGIIIAIISLIIKKKEINVL